QEWELFDTPDGSQPNPLVLYEPQLENARAALESARAGRDQAELNLERTVIRTPFVSLVRSQNAAPGRHIAPGTPVAVLAEVNRAEIVVHLPPGDLRWINVPRAGDQNKGSEAAVRIMGNSRDFSRSGTVSRSLGQVDPETRMLGIVVEVEDPYAVFAGEQGGITELPFGSFVQVNITGKDLEDVMVVPRQALRQDSTVWIADQQNRLEIREVTVKRSQEDQVMISSGLTSGERIILTSISSPAEGMKLRVEENHE
ncbi:MAG: efflux RND transporter periplasmic adaptor subunit, partial [Desulfonatronovibrio sp.]